MRCIKCKQDKNDVDFNINRNKRIGRSEHCRQCHRDYGKSHYTRNKEYYKQKAEDYKQKLIQYVRALKSKPCLDCKVTYPFYVMHFDHRPGTEKLFNLSSAGRIARSLGAIQAEIEKCELVCANCHASRTYVRLNPLEGASVSEIEV